MIFRWIIVGMIIKRVQPTTQYQLLVTMLLSTLVNKLKHYKNSRSSHNTENALILGSFGFTMYEIYIISQRILFPLHSYQDIILIFTNCSHSIFTKYKYNKMFYITRVVDCVLLITVLCQRRNR